MKKLFLIDGSGYIFRAYHALPPLTAPDGTPVGAVYGFCNMLRNLITAHRMHHFLVVFDAGRQTFRQQIYQDYKAHRPPAPEDLIPQFALIREACVAFGVPNVEMADYEADDLIASYARKAAATNDQGETEFEVVIVSADKDLMQLVNEHITLFDPIKRKPIGAEQVIEKFGVPPARVIDVQALAGDSADNVPGVPGIGIKTAAELILAYGSLESLLLQAQTIKQPKRRQSLIDHAEAARISKKLVTLVDTLPLTVDFDALFVSDVSNDTLDFLRRMGFKTLLTRVESEIQKDSPINQHSITAPKKTNHNYQTLVDTDTIQAFLEAATNSGCAAFDTETTSLHIHDAILVGFSVAYRGNESGDIKAAYIPLRHHQEALGTFAKQANFEEVRPHLDAFLKHTSVLKIGHNIKYDMGILANEDLSIEAFDDTMLMSYCIHGGKHSHSMDALAKLYLGLKTTSFKEICHSGKNQITFDQVDLKIASDYACEDAEITLLLYEYLKPLLVLEKVSSLYFDVERPVIQSIVAMERQGILVDADVLSSFGVELNTRIQALQLEIFQITGHEFNIASPKQLGVVLFEEQGLPAPRNTKTGSYSTDADVLESLALKGFDLPKKVLEWRSLTKLLSTYVEGIQGQINQKTKRVHTSYALSGTATGRLSSSDPNLQNIPIRTEDGRRIRKAFIAAPGYTLISLDYSQIELRLLAHFADVPSLKQAFLDGIDSHKSTASILFGVPYNAVTDEQRRHAKTVNFGIIYGISAFGLANQLMIPQGEAAGLIRAYLERYPGIENFMKQKKEEAASNGFVTTLMGRHCFTPGIHDKNAALRQFAERQAVNAPLQGTNADIIKKAMAQVQRFLNESKIDARMLLQVHDELLFEVSSRPDVQSKFIENTKKIMENVVMLSVPLTVQIGMGQNWDDAK